MRHICPGDGCGYCESRIDAREYDDHDYSDHELDQRADGAGADMAYGREW